MAENASDRVKKMVQGLALRYTLAAIVVIALVFAIAFLPLFSQLTDEVRKQFSLDHDFEKAKIENYFDHIGDVAKQVSSRTQAKKLLAAYNENRSAQEKAAEGLKRILEDAVAGSPVLVHVTRMAADGRPIASVGEALSSGIAQRIVSDRPYHDRIHIDWHVAPGTEPLFIVDSPILDDEGTRIGNDIALFSMAPLETVLEEYRHYGESYRAYLGYEDREGTLHSVFRRDEKALARLAEADGVIVKKSPVPRGKGLRFITSAGKEETFASTDTLARNLALAVLAVALGGLVMVWRFSLPLQRNLIEETKENARISAELAEQGARFQDSIDFSPVPIALSDGSGNIVYLNRKFTELFGYTRDEIPTIDAWWPRAYPRASYREQVAAEWNRKIDRLLTTGEEFPPQEADVTCKNGAVRTISFRFGLLGEQGMTVFYDITERKRLEAEISDLNANLERRVEEEIGKREEQEKLLIQQSRLAMMGEMISMIAHQWRQPLNALGLMVQDIQDAKEFGELDDAYVDRTTVSAMRIVQRMSETIDDFRNFFRPDKEKTRFSAEEVVREVAEMVDASLKGNDIDLEIDIRDKVEIEGYRGEFSQVILNLLANAKDAMKEKSSGERKITVTVEKTEKEKARIAVEDTGAGIPEEILHAIFDPYFTTKESSDGTGLGLYMAKMIVEKNMGGVLTVSNTSGGARFVITM